MDLNGPPPSQAPVQPAQGYLQPAGRGGYGAALRSACGAMPTGLPSILAGVGAFLTASCFRLTVPVMALLAGAAAVTGSGLAMMVAAARRRPAPAWGAAFGALAGAAAVYFHQSLAEPDMCGSAWFAMMVSAVPLGAVAGAAGGALLSWLVLRGRMPGARGADAALAPLALAALVVAAWLLVPPACRQLVETRRAAGLASPLEVSQEAHPVDQGLWFQVQEDHMLGYWDSRLDLAVLRAYDVTGRLLSELRLTDCGQNGSRVHLDGARVYVERWEKTEVPDPSSPGDPTATITRYWSILRELDPRTGAQLGQWELPCEAGAILALSLDLALTEARDGGYRQYRLRPGEPAALAWKIDEGYLLASAAETVLVHLGPQTVCLDRASGRELWRGTYGDLGWSYDESLGRWYGLNGEKGVLCAVSASDGSVIWRHALSSKTIGLLVAGEQLLIYGQDVEARGRANGEAIWTTRLAPRLPWGNRRPFQAVMVIQGALILQRSPLMRSGDPPDAVALDLETGGIVGRWAWRTSGGPALVEADRFLLQGYGGELVSGTVTPCRP